MSPSTDNRPHYQQHRLRRWLAESGQVHRGFLVGVGLLWCAALVQRSLAAALPLAVVGAALMALYRSRAS